MKKIFALMLALVLCLSAILLVSCDDRREPDQGENNDATNDNGGAEPVKGELKFTLNDDKVSYMVSGMGSYTATEIIIPSEYNGLPVTAIGEYAFYNRSDITSVTIPESVMRIGSRAFDGCSGLTSIAIPDSVISIGYGSFYYCTKLASVTLGNRLESIGGFAFSYCTRLTSITIGEKVTSISNSAFYGCVSLAEAKIGKAVTSIGHSAFDGCPKLETVTYSGTTDEWDEIEKVDTTFLSGVSIDCSDGTITT